MTPGIKFPSLQLLLAQMERGEYRLQTSRPRHGGQIWGWKESLHSRFENGRDECQGLTLGSGGHWLPKTCWASHARQKLQLHADTLLAIDTDNPIHMISFLQRTEGLGDRLPFWRMDRYSRLAISPSQIRSFSVIFHTVRKETTAGWCRVELQTTFKLKKKKKNNLGKNI